MALIKRLKRLWELSEFELDYDKRDGIRRTSPRLKPAPIGNGKAVFLPDMTEEEYQKYVHEELNGWKRFTNKLFRR